MYSQGDWEVMLNGNAQDLRALSDHYISDYFRIWGGIDHWNDCKNDHFSFNSLYFEGESDPNTVWQISYELLSLFNGATELLFKNANKLAIAGVNLKGSPTVFCPNEFTTGLLGLPGITASTRDEEIKKACSMSPEMALMILATENEDAYMILKYLDLDRSWSNYYKLMETVESHAKSKNLSVVFDKAIRTRFTNTANNYSLAGFDARHGFKQNIKANKTPTMTMNEAYAAITDLCKSYFVASYPQHFKRK